MDTILLEDDFAVCSSCDDEGRGEVTTVPFPDSEVEVIVGLELDARPLGKVVLELEVGDFPPSVTD